MSGFFDPSMLPEIDSIDIEEAISVLKRLQSGQSNIEKIADHFEYEFYKTKDNKCYFIVDNSLGEVLLFRSVAGESLPLEWVGDEEKLSRMIAARQLLWGDIDD